MTARLAVAGVLALLLAAAPARAADWLEHAWDEGGDEPAVTLTAEGGVILVLPEATLAAARRAGLSTKDAVTAFLERYGQHCSDLLDLDQPHAGLRVLLSLSRATPLPGLFVTDDEEVPLVIDYVPTRRAVCVTPGEPGPTS